MVLILKNSVVPTTKAAATALKRTTELLGKPTGEMTPVAPPSAVKDLGPSKPAPTPTPSQAVTTANNAEYRAAALAAQKAKMESMKTQMAATGAPVTAENNEAYRAAATAAEQSKAAAMQKAMQAQPTTPSMAPAPVATTPAPQPTTPSVAPAMQAPTPSIAPMVAPTIPMPQSGMSALQPTTSSMPQAPASLGFSFEDYASMTPEQRVFAQAQALEQGGAMQQKQLEEMFNAQDQLIADRQAQKQLEVDAEKMRLQGMAEADIAAYKADVEAQRAKAIESATQQGAQRLEGVKESLSFQGFARSTKAADLAEQVRSDTAAQIADIERESGRMINTFQAQAMENVNARVEEMQARVDQLGDQRDMLGLQKLEAQQGLMMDLFKQNPLNPQNMIATAEKIAGQKLEMQKMDLEERKQLSDQVAKNFQFMTEKFGSEFINNLSPEARNNYASALGIPPDVLAGISKMQVELDRDWDILKYTDSQNFEWQKIQNQNQFDLDRDFQKYGFDVDILDRKNAFEVDLINLKSQVEQDKSLKAWGGIISGLNGQYAQVGIASDGSSMTLGQPVQHPSSNVKVTDINVALAQAYPDGFKFNPKGAGDLTGQCKWFSQKLTTLSGKDWKIGSTAADTKKNLDKYVNDGKAFRLGDEPLQVGQTLITNDSKTYWHSATINAITPDGKIVLTESNYKGPNTVTNSRVLDPNNPKDAATIQGILKTELKPKYQVPSALQKTVSALGQATGLGNVAQGFNQGFGNIVRSGIETPINQRIGIGQAAMQTGGGDQNAQVVQSITDVLRANPDADVTALLSARPDLAPYVAEAQKQLKQSAPEKALPSSVLDQLSKYRTVDAQLGNLGGALDGLATKLGPAAGKINKLNPYDTDVQNLQSLITTLNGPAARTIMLEVGALTESDLQRVQQVLPQMSDTPAVAAQKLKNLMANSKLAQQGIYDVYGTAGYNVAPLAGLAPIGAATSTNDDFFNF